MFPFTFGINGVSDFLFNLCMYKQIPTKLTSEVKLQERLLRAYHKQNVDGFNLPL